MLAELQAQHGLVKDTFDQASRVLKLDLWEVQRRLVQMFIVGLVVLGTTLQVVKQECFVCVPHTWQVY